MLKKQQAYLACRDGDILTKSITLLKQTLTLTVHRFSFHYNRKILQYGVDPSRTLTLCFCVCVCVCNRVTPAYVCLDVIMLAF